MKHGVRSGILKLNKMSDQEVSGNSDAAIPEATMQIPHGYSHGVSRFIPTGIAAPKPLKMEGNLADNWKKFRRSWNNYAIIARLDTFEEQYKTA